jgi:hypothetical protein
MDEFEKPFWDLTQVVAWAITREPEAVRAAADRTNEYALLELKEARLRRLHELNERLWRESGRPKPNDPRGFQIEILSPDVDYADLPPPFDDERAKGVKKLEAEGKIRVWQQNAFPIVDYLLSLFQAGTLPALCYRASDGSVRALSANDWAWLEIAGGDHERLHVLRRAAEGASAVADVRVERAQVLRIFPPDGVAPWTIPVKLRKRRPTKQAAVAVALARLFPSGPPPHKRDELLRVLKRELGLAALSPRTLSRALAEAWQPH